MLHNYARFEFVLLAEQINVIRKKSVFKYQNRWICTRILMRVFMGSIHNWCLAVEWMNMF